MAGYSPSSNGGLPLYGDESYQGPPLADFDSSRGDYVVAFAQRAALNANTPPGGSAVSTPRVGAMKTWRESAAKDGANPSDFGFLMESPMKGKKSNSFGDFSPSASEDPVTPPRSIKSVSSAPTPLADAAKDTVMDLVDAGGWQRQMSDTPVKPVAKKRGRIGSESTESAPFAKPPCPPQKPHTFLFGRVDGEERGNNPMDPPIPRTDVFHWMRCDNPRENPEVRRHLDEETAYKNEILAHLEPFREELYKEMLSHRVEEETSLITLHSGGYGYFTRTFVGKPYEVHYRCKSLGGGAWGEPELVLDENRLAIDSITGSQRPYLSVSGPDENPTHSLYVYGTDFNGDDAYTLHACTCGDGSQVVVPSLEIPRTSGSVEWSPQGDCFYYVDLDSEFRPYSLKRHVLSHDPTGSEDATLFEELDQKFCVTLERSGCKRFLILNVDSTETSEVYLIDLESADAALRRVTPRRYQHRYHVDHRGGSLYILTNKDGCKNSKLCRCPLAALPDVPPETWEDVWAPSKGVMLTEAPKCFQDFMALEGRENGACRVFVRGYDSVDGIQHHGVIFPDVASHSGRIHTPRGYSAATAAFSASLAENPIFETSVLRYHYSSFTVPETTYEYCVRSRESKLVHVQQVPHFDPNLYQAERIVTSRRSVPISLVYRKDIHPLGLKGGPFPLLLTGYGAYGACSDPDFCGNRLTLLDRGMVYAIAHIRGGSELGREWYEDGAKMNVKNRFSDFVEAAEELQALQIAAPGKMVAWGTSSGGKLVTGAMNLRPDLFRAVLLEVPFVDVMFTMADPSIPLTIGEWEEIGNPNEREYFYYMQEYSPYENIRMAEYPAALVTSSLNDAMVGYWEPLKYVAKLRSLKADTRPVVLQANFHAGHGASSDRYECMREASTYFAFLMDQLGLKPKFDNPELA